MKRFFTTTLFAVKFLPILVLVAVGVFLFSAGGAQAGIFDCISDVGDCVGGVVGNILYAAVLVPLGWVLSAVGTLADHFLQPFVLTSSTLVTTGWTIARDFANSLFILILLGIALNFILGFESFGLKRALPKLLLIALLINFSLPIAGVFLDFANITANSFLSGLTPGCGVTSTIERLTQNTTCSFTAVIANNLKLTKLFEGQQIQKGGDVLLDVIFAIFFMLGTVFVLAVLAAMFAIRIGYLSFLLVVLPVVLVLYAFPPTSGHFKDWMSKFIKWTMFAPIALFFLYIAMVAFQGSFQGDVTTALAGETNEKSFFQQALTYIIIWMIMLGGLVAAQSMGGKATAAVMSAATTGRKWAQKKAGRGASAVGAATARRFKAEENLNKVAEGLQKALPGWAGGGLMAGALRGVASKTGQAVKKREGLTETERKDYERMVEISPDEARTEMDRLATSTLPGSGAKAAELGELLAKKGKLKVINKETGEIDSAATETLVKQAYAAAKTHGKMDAIKTIRKSNPIIYQDIVQEEWEKLESEHKLSGATYDLKTKRLVQGKRKDTGESFEDAKNKAFDEMTTADFENLKGSWNATAVDVFVKSGSMTSGTLRSANNTADHEFLTYVTRSLAGLSLEETEELQRKAPGLVSFLKGGNASNNGVDVPQSFLDKVNEVKEDKEQRFGKEDEERSKEDAKRAGV
ncbi:MAG: hypothetical protein AAB581_04315 [Patescibacteria group bacterium]